MTQELGRKPFKSVCLAIQFHLHIANGHIVRILTKLALKTNQRGVTLTRASEQGLSYDPDQCHSLM